MNYQKILILLLHAFVGWALCAATMTIGMAVTSQQNALIIHAIGAPIYFTLVSLSYFRKFHFTSPLLTAIIFTGFVTFVDFFGVALLAMRSLEMFTSILGTWIPFTLIFLSTYLSGRYIAGRKSTKAAQAFPARE
jgi:hypothetical protein